MEILIPGIILVALMAWASTRIKRNAAAAFDIETVDGGEFLIVKPEGFLHVLNDDSAMAFRAYSKEFGKVGDRDVRRATIEIQRHTEREIDELKSELEGKAESISTFEPYIDAGERAAFMSSTEIVDGGEYFVSRKLVTRGPDVWESRYSVLSEHQEELSETLETALDSIRIK